MIDENGNTQYRYQDVVAVDYGYYLPAYEGEYYIPENATNVQFYGVQNSEEIGNDDGFDIYRVMTWKVDDSSASQMGYTYNLPDDTTVRYGKNYHLEYWTYHNISSDIKRFVCIPSDASFYPVDYDSRPPRSGLYIIPTPAPMPATINTVISTITPPKIYLPGYTYETPEEQISKVDPCPTGYKDKELSVGDGYNLLIYDFSNPNHDLPNFEYSAGTINANGPVVYKYTIQRNIDAIVPLLPDFNSEFKLSPPARYRVNFISDSDQAFADSDYDKISQSSSDGYILVKTKIMQSSSDEFFQINLLRAIIGSAMMNTYGNGVDNWWTDGASTLMGTKLMKSHDLKYDKLQESLDQTRYQFSEMSKEEVNDYLNDPSINQPTINAAMVEEIDVLCPNHILKLNEETAGLSDLGLNDTGIFDNYLIYRLKSDCGADITSKLDKYQLPHDDVFAVLNNYERIKSNIDLLKPSDRYQSRLDRAKGSLSDAKTLIEKGRIKDAIIALENLASEYQLIQKAVELGLKLDDLRLKLSAIPPEFRPESITLALNRLDEASKALDNDDIATASVKISDAESVYAQLSPKLKDAISDYADTKTKINAVPIVFSMPSKMLADMAMSQGAAHIKNSEYELASEDFGSARFWIDNSVVMAILSLFLILGILFVAARLLQQPPKHKK